MRDSTKATLKEFAGFFTYLAATFIVCGGALYLQHC